MREMLTNVPLRQRTAWSMIHWEQVLIAAGLASEKLHRKVCRCVSPTGGSFHQDLLKQRAYLDNADRNVNVLRSRKVSKMKCDLISKGSSRMNSKQRRSSDITLHTVGCHIHLNIFVTFILNTNKSLACKLKMFMNYPFCLLQVEPLGSALNCCQNVQD